MELPDYSDILLVTTSSQCKNESVLCWTFAPALRYQQYPGPLGWALRHGDHRGNQMINNSLNFFIRNEVFLMLTVNNNFTELCDNGARVWS